MSISPPFGRYGQAHIANKSTIKPITIFRRVALYISGATVIASGPFKCTATMAFRASTKVSTQPQLHLPLRVGLSFLPGNGREAEGGLDAAHKEALLEEIRQRFVSRKFVADIVASLRDRLDGAGVL
jgi:hypothetical protein